MKRFLSQSGQMTLEYTLVLILLIGITFVVSRFFKANDVFAAYVEGPWPKIQGMIESGVWQPPAQARLLHPLQNDRRSSPDPRDR